MAPTRYTLYIDESGDLGLDKIRDSVNSRGASPYLVIGGALIPNSKQPVFHTLLDDLKVTFKKPELHCSKLNHAQILKCCHEVSCQENILFFAFVSRKDTLGGYKSQIKGQGQDQRYYNKCCSYFFEQVGRALAEHSIKSDQLSIIFEERSHDYQRLRRYVERIQKTPHDERAFQFLTRIDPLSITSQPKSSNALLFLADLVAYSAYQALNLADHNYGVADHSYLLELHRKFFSDRETGQIGDYGLKIFKRNGISLDNRSLELVRRIYRKRKKQHQDHRQESDQDH